MHCPCVDNAPMENYTHRTGLALSSANVQCAATCRLSSGLQVHTYATRVQDSLSGHNQPWCHIVRWHILLPSALTSSRWQQHCPTGPAGLVPLSHPETPAFHQSYAQATTISIAQRPTCNVQLGTRRCGRHPCSKLSCLLPCTTGCAVVGGQ